MDVPPEIAFRNVEATEELKERILEGIDKLEEVYPGLVACRVMVEDTTPGRRSGNEYNVRLELSIPNKTIMVEQDQDPSSDNADVHQMLREAFSVGRKRLLKVKDMQRGHVKDHHLPPHGRVTRLLVDDTGVRYGFLVDREGTQIYFHENALADDLDYDELEVGDEVRFAAAGGDKGPQASTVARLSPGSVGPTERKEIPMEEVHEG